MKAPAAHPDKDRLKAVDLTIASIERQYGKGSIMKLGSREALLKDLQATRIRGYAIDDEETREGMCCFGAPVFDSSGSHAIAPVAVSTLKRPGDSGGKLPVTQAVLEFARVLSKRLGAKGKLF